MRERNSPFIKKKTFDKYHHESLNANDSAVTVTSGITRFSTKIEKKRKEKRVVCDFENSLYEDYNTVLRKTFLGSPVTFLNRRRQNLLRATVSQG